MNNDWDIIVHVACVSWNSIWNTWICLLYVLLKHFQFKNVYVKRRQSSFFVESNLSTRMHDMMYSSWPQTLYSYCENLMLWWLLHSFNFATMSFFLCNCLNLIRFASMINISICVLLFVSRFSQSLYVLYNKFNWFSHQYFECEKAKWKVGQGFELHRRGHRWLQF